MHDYDWPSSGDLALIIEVARQVALQNGAGRDDADDIAQTTAIKMLSKWDTPHVRLARARGPGGWRSYVAVAARNAHLDLTRATRRREARQRRAVDAAEYGLNPRPGVVRSPLRDGAQVEELLARALIVEEVRALRGRRRQVAERILLQEYSIAETAKALGLHARTVRQHLQEAREQLIARLTAPDPDH
ncbi:MAG: sigma-70 family RNA polymerase sigma factor [Acidimicrobiia bacterium]|nr:sigma-70 family RNA polymerase sigma factor [Acidimicrobiia bacterium]